MSKLGIVTGGASGIGWAIATSMLQMNYSVIVIDLISPPKSSHQKLHSIIGDIKKKHCWIEVRKNIRDAGFDKIDALVNNAGIQILAPVNDFLDSDYENVLATNVSAILLGLRELWNYLKSGTSIVNIGSVHGLASGAGFSLYAASKGAVNALTRALAVELAPLQIRVNAVLPGAINTEMLQIGLQQHNENITSALQECASRQVMGRIASPSEVAEAVVFLLDSSRSSFITGSELIVDGGGMAALSTLR